VDDGNGLVSCHGSIGQNHMGIVGFEVKVPAENPVGGKHHEAGRDEEDPSPIELDEEDADEGGNEPDKPNHNCLDVVVDLTVRVL